MASHQRVSPEHHGQAAGGGKRAGFYPKGLGPGKSEEGGGRGPRALPGRRRKERQEGGDGGEPWRARDTRGTERDSQTERSKDHIYLPTSNKSQLDKII